VASRRSTEALTPQAPGLGEAALDLFDIPAPVTQTPLGVDGHRRRLRERLLSAGPDALADHEMLEIVLFALPRRDTKPLARALLTRFGSFAASIAAPNQDLLAVEGLGDAGVAALKSVHAAALRLLRAEVIDRPVLTNWPRLMEYLTAELSRERIEQFRVLFLDNRNRLLADELILVHNHPSGDPTPSEDDIDMTQRIKAAAGALSIVVHDHIIVGNGRWFSFRKEALL